MAHPIIRTSALEACCLPSCGQLPPAGQYQHNKAQNPFLLISSQFTEPILLTRASYFHTHQWSSENIQLRILVSIAYHFGSFLTNLPKSFQTDKHQY